MNSSLQFIINLSKYKMFELYSDVRLIEIDSFIVLNTNHIDMMKWWQ